ncbi:MAG TPA: 16S rRNA (guanine(527)-N(7))-methyltransferase RsmG [Micropepsaceae bacterium]|nr:16S rRNA (guanine(527)-N(7))-methyltransferase RsmG [Micropepsaceae bacterium]
MAEAHGVEGPLTPEGFAGILPVSRETLARLSLFVELLRAKNEVMNLVSPASLGDVWRRHILDSAQVYPLIPKSARKLCDVGSGGGFPGLVLAAMAEERGDIHATLIESIGKKCEFLREAAAAMGLAEHVTVAHGRAEDQPKAAFDVMTARAVAPVEMLLGYGAHLVRKGGCVILLKGAKAQDELTAARRSWKMSVTSVASLSDPSGTLLIVKDFSRVTRNDGRAKK